MNKKTLILLSTIVITSISSNAFSKSAESYLNEGIKYLESNNLDKAEKSLKTAIKLNKNLYIAYSKLGNVYLERGDNNTAISYYNKALKINPKYPNAYNNLGLAYINLEQSEKALGYFNQALKLDPKDEIVLNNIEMLKLTIIAEKDQKAESFISEKEYDQALKIYQEFLKKDPNSSEYNSKIGLCYAKMNKFDIADNYLQKALKLDKENDIANFNMGNYYIEKIKSISNPQNNVDVIEKHMRNAETYFETACDSGNELACDNRELRGLKSSLGIGFTEEEKENIETLFKEGLDFYNKKKYDDAISSLEEAYNLDPANKKIINAFFNAKKAKGAYLIKIGKKEEGQELIDEANFTHNLIKLGQNLREATLIDEMAKELQKNNHDKIISSLENFKSEEPEMQNESNKLLLVSYIGKVLKSIEKKDFNEAKIYVDKFDTFFKGVKTKDKDLMSIALVNKFSSRILSISSAFNYLEENKYDDAELELTKIIDKEPNNFVAYSSLGIVKSKLGEIDEAFKLSKKAIELAPNDPFNYYDLASIYLDKNDNLNTIANLKKSIKLEPALKII